MTQCLFCNVSSMEKLLDDPCFYAMFDKYPVNPGHVLIISKNHVPDFFHLCDADLSGLYKIMKDTKKLLDSRFNPDGYNIGMNCGAAAGQTIFHFHLHVIPRYERDVDTPRGGVRNIKIPVVEY